MNTLETMKRYGIGGTMVLAGIGMMLGGIMHEPSSFHFTELIGMTLVIIGVMFEQHRDCKQDHRECLDRLDELTNHVMGLTPKEGK